MKEITKLRLTIVKIESVTLSTEKSSVVFQSRLLARRSEEVVTDELLVTDEAVRVLAIRN